MNNKILSKDYKEELANIAEVKGFGQDAENLLLSMLYKAEDGYNNYQTVKREVPKKEEFMSEIVNNVADMCSEIQIIAPNSKLAIELKKNKCKILNEPATKKGKKVFSYPNEKTLLYGISKAGLKPINEKLSVGEKAIITAVSIGKCISTSEVIRDFNGWSWSILEKEIESTECNIIYQLLVYLFGYKFINNVNSDNIRILKKNMPDELWNELQKMAIQFYLNYDKNENEIVLKMLAQYKTKLSKMKDQAKYVTEIGEEKKFKIKQIRQIDEIVNSPQLLRQQYSIYNSKLPNEKKIFSVSHYEDLLQKQRNVLLAEINEYNKMQNPNEFLKARDQLIYQVKLYESKTEITKFQNEFLKCFEKKIDATNDKKGLTNLLYEIRYLNFLPSCKMKLNNLERKLIPKAINARVLNPISNNDEFDYRFLAGIFDSQVVSLEGLYIRLQTVKEGIQVEIYDGEELDRKYLVDLPEGSNVEIKKIKKNRIFE